jgi:hypothetical protein
MTRQEAQEFNAKRAKFLCEKHGCSEKKRKLHFNMIVYEAWNPHPSEEFIDWWRTQPEFLEHDVDAERARNCKVYCDRFKEAVSVGAAELPADYPT